MNAHKESKQARIINAMLPPPRTGNAATRRPATPPQPEIIDLISSDEEDEAQPAPTAQARTAPLRTTSAPSALPLASTQPTRTVPVPPPAVLPLNRTYSQPAGPSTRSEALGQERYSLRRTRKPLEQEERRARRRPTRAELERAWSDAAAREGARGIRIVNEVDDEDIPNVPDDFEWLERKYQYPGDYESHESDRRQPCTCFGPCSALSRCDCFDLSDLGPFGQSVAAYTKSGYLQDGLASSPLPFLVHECTDRCSCAPHCRNRLAQSPRDVPLEIFKTAACGWGVRAPVDLPGGKVLGIYTGDLSRRDESDDEEDYDGHSSRDPSSDGADTFDGEGSGDSDSDAEPRAKPPKKQRLSRSEEKQLRESYEFFLDWDDASTWLVGAYQRGNWTRFINHCCEPNLRVYSMTCETDPKATHLPSYLVFATKTPIPAGRELTFDYDPRYADQEAVSVPRKKRAMMREGCRCGAGARCRGFMRLPV
ncbi:unnamed protein product [Peniophora sp. CBMAI 1063]|nr:unnamed protein product [Peniophora sp. CBMAI 1063]